MEYIYLLLLSVLFFIEHTSSQVTIEVRDFQENARVLETYTFPEGFSNPLDWYITPYANIPSQWLTGIVYQPVPVTACSVLDPITFCEPTNLPNTTWIANVNLTRLALVNGYQICTQQKIDNVKTAGYDALITFSYNDSDIDVTSHVLDRNSGVLVDVETRGFPIVIVSEQFANILSEVAATASTGCPTTLVTIRSDPIRQNWIAFAISMAMVVTIVGIPLIACLCMSCGLCCPCIRGKDCCPTYCCKSSGVYEVNEVQVRVLGDNLLRRYPLQELEDDVLERNNNSVVVERFERVYENNVEPRARKYKAAKERNMSCAICLECFNDEETVHALACDEHHVFHPHCIKRWLNVHNVCPVCRTYVIQTYF